MTLYSFCMSFSLTLLGLVGHSAVERKKEKVCKHRKRGSSQAVSQSSKRPIQTPALPLVQDIRAQGKDAVTTMSQVAMVLKAENIEDSECQSSAKTMQTSVFCMQYSNPKAKSTALTVRRTTRRAATKRMSCTKPTAKDCHEVTSEGQSAVSFEMVTPEPQSRKSQRHLAVSNERNSSPHQTGEVSDASVVYQKGRKMCKVLYHFEQINDIHIIVQKHTVARFCNVTLLNFELPFM